MIDILVDTLMNCEGDCFYSICIINNKDKIYTIGKCEMNNGFYKKYRSLNLCTGMKDSISFENYKDLVKRFIPITNFPMINIPDPDDEQLYLFNKE